jgi:sugar/nucleoside kinase (ribokinase family)
MADGGSLRVRLATLIDKQLDQYFGDRGSGPEWLLPVVGNSLTRIAASESGGANYSWTQWLNDALNAGGAVATDSQMLESFGYEQPEILSLAMATPGGHRHGIFKFLFDQTRSLPPTPAHRALVAAAKAIATTNYDDLIEEAAVRGKLFRKDCVIDVPGGESEPDRIDNEVLIYKLHGSLPRHDIGGRRADEARFDGWMKDVEFRPHRIIGTQESYLQHSMGSINSVLVNVPRLRKLLDSQDTLVLFFGLGFYPAERVLMRLLYGQDQEVRNKMALVVAHPDDPLLRWSQHGIDTVRIPVGLAGSTRRRLLAFLVLLERLSHRVRFRNLAAAERAICEGIRDLGASPATDVQLAETRSIVTVVGQAAYGRIIGIERSVTQESVFGPVAGTPAPDVEDEVLVVDEALGQALTPALVWDAIGLPSSLIAEVGHDGGGREILRRLGKADWIDSDGVTSLLAHEGATAPGVATETFVSMGWNGLRTILDAKRYFEARSGLSDLEIAKGVNRPIVYVTKAMWEQIRDALQSTKESVRPILVLETGSAGHMEAEAWVAENDGVILASAMSFLNWLEAKDLPVEEGSQAAREWHEQNPAPADETGRYWQYFQLLERLRGTPIPKCIGTPDKPGQLYRARVIVVTVGEVGAVYWTRTDGGWKGPWWCVTESFLSDFRALPDSEVRDALGCGDCARAGFVASLAASIDYRHYGRGPLPDRWTHQAVVALNWFGTQKLRFFGIERYLKHLRLSALTGVSRLADPNLSVTPGDKVRLGDEPWETMCIETLHHGADLHHKLEEFIKEFLSEEARTKAVVDRGESWRRARGLKPTRLFMG